MGIIFQVVANDGCYISGALSPQQRAAKAMVQKKGGGAVAGSGSSPQRNADHVRAGTSETIWASYLSTSLWLLGFAFSPDSACCAMRGPFLRKVQAVIQRVRSPHSQGVEERSTGSGAGQPGFKP